MTPQDIRKVRSHLGLTQAEFGQLLGAHGMTVSRWELGQLAPTAYQQALMATFRTAAQKKGQFDESVKALLVAGGMVAVLLFLLNSAKD